jgi:20S proteasome alpha/beta subunit
MSLRPHSTLSESRLLRSKAVTIVLGLKTPQGVILAADTQESFAESHKVNRPKLVHKESEANVCGLPIGFAAAGAGFGPWIDKLTTVMWDAVQDATNLDEGCDKIEETIKSRYQEYEPLIDVVNTEMIYGVGASGATRLFHAYGPVVNEVNLRTSGSGQPIADFLLRHFNYGMHITNAMVMAVYVLYCAKQHADGCGGDSHIAILQNNGQSYLLDAVHVGGMERVLERTSTLADLLLMLAGNPISTPESIRNAAPVLADDIIAELSKVSDLPSIKELLAKLEGLNKRAIG